MWNSYIVFDAESVQLQTRRRVTRLAIPCLVAVLGTVGLIALLASQIVSPVIGWPAIFAIWGLALGWVFRRRQRLKSVMWCVKISADEVVGYDYSRTRYIFPWDSVSRIEITDKYVELINDRGRRMVIPAVFQEYTELSHLLVAHAERHNVELRVDGRPFDEIDVYELFPSLLDDTPGPNAPRSSATP